MSEAGCLRIRRRSEVEPRRATQSMNREVVITGIGLVSPIGNEPDLFWEGMRDGRSGVGPVTRFDATRFSCRLVAEASLDNRVPGTGRYAHEIRRMARFVQYALAASRSALSDSKLTEAGGETPRGGVFVGVGVGGLPHIEQGVLRQETRGPRKTSPYLIPATISNMAAGLVSLDLRLSGPQMTLAGACAGGTQALGEAFWAIRGGRLDWALAGGTDSALTPLAFSGFEAMRALSARSAPEAAPRPFDRERDGMIIGEGAAFFVLEERERAEARGVRVRGIIRGYATVSGGQSLVRGCPESAARGIAAAVEDAGLGPGQVDVIFAQGTGMASDEVELATIKAAFYDRGAHPAITSIEGHIGHTFAASGPLSMAAALRAFQHQELPATLGLEAVAPGYEDLDVLAKRRPARVKNCLIHTHGFGGLYATVVCSEARDGDAPMGA